MSNKKSLLKLTNKELKQKCRDEKLKVSGKKSEMVKRLCEAEKDQVVMSNRAVNTWLKTQGITDVKQTSYCLRAGIQNGYVDISGREPLDNIFLSDKCYMCDSDIDITIRDLLYQSEYGGGDYESGGTEGAVKCPNKKCEITGMYVSAICRGSPLINSGKEHHHCTVCPGFGRCMGDYRMKHCNECGEHFHSSRFPPLCPCKGSDSDDDMPFDENGILKFLLDSKP